MDDHLKVGENNELCSPIILSTAAGTCALQRVNPDTNCAMCGFGSYIDTTAKTTCVSTDIKAYGENETKCAGDENNTSNIG